MKQKKKEMYEGINGRKFFKNVTREDDRIIRRNMVNTNKLKQNATRMMKIKRISNYDIQNFVKIALISVTNMYYQ